MFDSVRIVIFVKKKKEEIVVLTVWRSTFSLDILIDFNQYNTLFRTNIIIFSFKKMLKYSGVQFKILFIFR